VTPTGDYRRYNMNKIKIKIIFGILVLLGVLILSAAPTLAESRNTSADAPLIMNTKYIKFDKNFGVHLLTVNISIPHTGTGKLVYVENYYGIDSHGKPRFYSSGTRYNIENFSGNASINIQRPRHRYGGSYSLIEKVIIINGERTVSWIDFSKYW
jgi:hypothetical protein